MIKKLKGNKLYHGTTELIAKSIPVKGLSPYEIPRFDNGRMRAIGSSSEGVCLTDTYTGLMAFDACGAKEKWGMVEIDVDKLDQKHFMPHELFLLEKNKKKIDGTADHLKKIAHYRSKLISNHKFWKESLNSIGLCIYQGTIPVSAITKITIFDWRTNWFMTREVFNSVISVKNHKMQIERHRLLNRWLMCLPNEPSEWVSEYNKLKPQEREPISMGVINKSGLDIYYQQSTGRK